MGTRTVSRFMVMVFALQVGLVVFVATLEIKQQWVLGAEPDPVASGTIGLLGLISLLEWFLLFRGKEIAPATNRVYTQSQKRMIQLRSRPFLIGMTACTAAIIGLELFSAFYAEAFGVSRAVVGDMITSVLGALLITMYALVFMIEVTSRSRIFRKLGT